MSWRAIQKPSLSQVRGVAIGWLIPDRPELNAKLRIALPGWAIVATTTAPLSVVSSDLQAARKLVGVPSDTPVLLFGWSAGCQAVRACLISKIVDPWGVAVFDGTHANVPPADWQIDVWANLAERAGAGLGAFIGTATSMTYTKDIEPGKKGRAWPTSWVLARALGLKDGELKPSVPVTGNGLYVSVYPSKDIDADAHNAQILDVAPKLLARLAAGPGAPAKLNAINCVPEPGSDFLDPSLTLSERLVVWAMAEIQRWEEEGLSESSGPNESPRIREYYSLTFKRRVTEQILKLHGVAWCAIAACYGVSQCLLPTDPRGIAYRVSGIELEQDAKANGVWSKNPEPGSLIIMFRSGPSWGRHVGIVLTSDSESVTFGAGNDGDTWAERTIKRSDPLISGYVAIG